MSDKTLSHMVALVTGACSEVGAATARRLAREGAAVALVDPSRQRLDGLAADIAAEGEAALAVEADLTDPGRAAQAVEAVVDRFDRIDLVINSGGLMIFGTALHSTLEAWDRMLALNVKALLHVTHAAVPYLIDAAATSPRGVADIVNVGSAAGRVAGPGRSVYSLTQFGVIGFTEALRQELLVERVRVSVIAPCTVSTELSKPRPEARRPAGRLVDGTEPLRPEDVADAIAYIVTRDRHVAVDEVLIRPGL